MYNLTITTPISVFVSLAALAGVAVHDTKIDKLATTFVGTPAMMANAESGHKGISNDPHTHVERVSLKDASSSQPRLLPRNEQRKHFLQKGTPKGAHSHDGYCLPLA
jgi:hypothetical protein